MTERAHTPRVLSIAGSDSGGGAGIQADLKAFARCGVHGMSAITAITAQNTRGVLAVHPVPPEIVLAQVRAVVGDIGVDAVKVGMLGTPEVTLAVARALEELPPGTPVVVDPVMVAESGARLLAEDAQRMLIEEILPRATVLTPNLPEARALVGRAPAAVEGSASDGGDGRQSEGRSGHGSDRRDGRKDDDGRQGDGGSGDDDEDREARELALAILGLGCASVVLTGGHRARAVDLYLDVPEDERIVEIVGERHPGGAAHGSGCTHSSVLAAQLALGRSALEAARIARRLAGEAVRNGLRDVGEGPGPVDVLGLADLRNRP